MNTTKLGIHDVIDVDKMDMKQHTNYAISNRAVSKTVQALG